MAKKIISKSPRDTEKIAQDFLTKIKAGKKSAIVVALSGELGAGKTTFTQALGKELGIKKKINSPTFVIMKKYSITSIKHEYLYHLDAYRLKNEKELEKLGWADIVADPKNLILIEWPENVSKVIPKKHISIKIAHTKEGHRKFEIK